MRLRYFTILLSAAITLCFATSVALAGLNAGATAKMYWVNGSFKAAYLNETSCTPKLVVTVTGLTSIRGANVQIWLQGAFGSLPPSWQMEPGGCAEGALQTARSGFPSGISTAWGAGTGFTDTQNQMYYGYSDCLTPHGTGVLWLATTGTSGLSRTATLEYGLYTMIMDQSSGLCAGNCVTNLHGVCLNLWLRDPCPSPTVNGPYIQLFDGSLAVDNVPVTAGRQWLLWNLSNLCECSTCTDAPAGSWGRLKRSYR